MGLIDFISDCFFVWELFAIENEQCYTALAFVAIPFTANAGLVMFLMNREFQSAEVLFFIWFFFKVLFFFSVWPGVVFFFFFFFWMGGCDNTRSCFFLIFFYSFSFFWACAFSFFLQIMAVIGHGLAYSTVALCDPILWHSWPTLLVNVCLHDIEPDAESQRGGEY